MFAWVIVRPDLLMMELEKALKRLGITQEFFTFKIMTPIYAEDEPKLKDINYYSKQDKPYDFASEKKKEEHII